MINNQNHQANDSLQHKIVNLENFNNNLSKLQRISCLTAILSALTEFCMLILLFFGVNIGNQFFIGIGGLFGASLFTNLTSSWLRCYNNTKLLKLDRQLLTQQQNNSQQNQINLLESVTPNIRYQNYENTNVTLSIEPLRNSNGNSRGN